MSNLTPEQRVNKLGHVVTKHVRSGAKTTAPKKTMPAPSLAGKAKGHQLRPKQLEERDVRLTGFGPVHSALGNQPYHHSIFYAASDVQAYDVMSVTDYNTAAFLLEQGVKTAEEAKQKLRYYKAEQLIKDHSALMQEMLVRNVSSEATINALHDMQGTWGSDSGDLPDSPFLADAIEFYAISSLRKQTGFISVRRGIMSGNIRLSDLRDVGVRRLKTGSVLFDYRNTFAKMAQDEYSFSTDDLNWFLDAQKSLTNHWGVGVEDGVLVLEHLGVEKLRNLKSLDSITAFHTNNVEHTTDEERRDWVDRTYYAAQIIEAMQDAGKTLDGYDLRREIAPDVDLMRNAGMSLEDAIKAKTSGLTGQQILGVMEGVHIDLSEGWL